MERHTPWTSKYRCSTVLSVFTALTYTSGLIKSRLFKCGPSQVYQQPLDLDLDLDRYIEVVQKYSMLSCIGEIIPHTFSEYAIWKVGF